MDQPLMRGPPRYLTGICVGISSRETVAVDSWQRGVVKMGNGEKWSRWVYLVLLVVPATQKSLPGDPRSTGRGNHSEQPLHLRHRYAGEVLRAGMLPVIVEPPCHRVAREDERLSDVCRVRCLVIPHDDMVSSFPYDFYLAGRVRHHEPGPFCKARTGFPCLRG